MAESFSLRAKIEQLEEIERYFQKPGMDLELAVKKHKEAVELAKQILAYLQKIETSLTKIDIGTLGATGSDSTDEALL